jgi:hypothetical protein
MMFDGLFHWTDDAGAEPPAPSATDDRRRRFIGASAIALLLTVLG